MLPEPPFATFSLKLTTRVVFAGMLVLPGSGEKLAAVGGVLSATNVVLGPAAGRDFRLSRMPCPPQSKSPGYRLR